MPAGANHPVSTYTARCRGPIPARMLSAHVPEAHRFYATSAAEVSFRKHVMKPYRRHRPGVTVRAKPLKNRYRTDRIKVFLQYNVLAAQVQIIT